MKKISAIILLAIATFTWTSCKEDDENEGPKTPTKTELLTAHAWKLAGLTINPPIVVEGTEFSDLYELDECWQDNTITFTPTNTFSSSEGANNCSEEDPQTSTGTWSFNTAETSIIIDAEDDVAQTATIKTLNETNFEMSYEMSIPELGWTGEALFKFSK